MNQYFVGRLHECEKPLKSGIDAAAAEEWLCFKSSMADVPALGKVGARVARNGTAVVHVNRVGFCVPRRSRYTTANRKVS